MNEELDKFDQYDCDKQRRVQRNKSVAELKGYEKYRQSYIRVCDFLRTNKGISSKELVNCVEIILEHKIGIWEKEINHIQSLIRDVLTVLEDKKEPNKFNLKDEYTRIERKLSTYLNDVKIGKVRFSEMKFRDLRLDFISTRANREAIHTFRGGYKTIEQWEKKLDDFFNKYSVPEAGFEDCDEALLE